MIVAKNFKWESAHRLPGHESKCRHIHGHSYKMIVELEGEPGPDGLVIDFQEIKRAISPFVDLLDHSTLIAENDMELKEVFDSKSWNYYLLPFDSTAENLCRHFTELILEKLSGLLRKHHIRSIGIKIFETGTAYAFLKTQLS